MFIEVGEEDSQELLVTRQREFLQHFLPHFLAFIVLICLQCFMAE